MELPQKADCHLLKKHIFDFKLIVSIWLIIFFGAVLHNTRVYLPLRLLICCHKHLHRMVCYIIVLSTSEMIIYNFKNASDW